MTREEFSQWMEDFLTRFPSLSDNVRQFTKGTRDIWFSDCFLKIELLDALQANHEIMLEGFKSYDLHNLPATVKRHADKIKCDRVIQQQREEDRQKHNVKPAVLLQEVGYRDTDCMHQSLHIKDTHRRRLFIEQWYDHTPEQPRQEVDEFCEENDLQEVTFQQGNPFSIAVKNARKNCPLCNGKKANERFGQR